MAVRSREEFVAYGEGSVVPGGWPLNGTSVKYENQRIISAGSARLYGISGYNSLGAGQFVLLFDGTVLPASGATAVVVIPVAATAGFSAYWGSVGRWFLQGIVVANSTTAPTLTLGAANCWFDAQFI